jgi:hypothetical protein
VGIFITGQERATTVEVNKRDKYVKVRSFCPCEADYLRAIERDLKARWKNPNLEAEPDTQNRWDDD